jgi:calcineurin-like phosphoesterase family protein
METHQPKKGIKTFFTSDNHFYHRNILKYCADTRQGEDIDDMHEIMIENWNEDVGPNDIVYILGDFSFANGPKTLAILKRLNGIKRLIKGNHEYWITPETEAQFDWIKEYHEMKFDGEKVIMFHYPIKEWNHMHHGAFHLFGHVHGEDMEIAGRAMDVGIDARPQKDMRVFTWDQVKETLLKQPIMPHGKGEKS